jgi:hypothetical protein
MPYEFDHYYKLYKNISLDEYLKDKSVEDIVNTCKWLENFNDTVFMEMINYFNSEPAEDLKYTKKNNGDGNCVKCLFPHDDTHECYAYDRIFKEAVFLLADNELEELTFKKQYDYNIPTPRQGRYNFQLGDYGCVGDIPMYLRVGEKWFERTTYLPECSELTQMGPNDHFYSI